MSEQQGLAEVMGCSSGDPDCGCDSAHDARHVLASRWLRAHDDRIRAEALAPVLALADEWDGSLPYYVGEDRRRVADDIDVRDLTAALRVAAGTPTHNTTEEET